MFPWSYLFRLPNFVSFLHFWSRSISSKHRIWIVDSKIRSLRNNNRILRFFIIYSELRYAIILVYFWWFSDWVYGQSLIFTGRFLPHFHIVLDRSEEVRRFVIIPFEFLIISNNFISCAYQTIHKRLFQLLCAQ